MPHLPVLSGRRVVRAFESLGWEVARQRGTLRGLIRDAGLTVEEFTAQI
jgi:predicted RNA binding protein YcfA (HicA-like mRNA interferase family)